METEKPILIKYGLIFGGKLSLNDYFKAENLISNTNFDFIFNLNKNNCDLNYKNLIIGYDYNNIDNKELNLKSSTFLICNLKDNDANKSYEPIEYKFKYTPNLCVLSGNRFNSYLKDNIYYFNRNNVQYIIADQNTSIKDFQYIIIKILFYSNGSQFECWHNYGWFLDYYKKNE
jgi:hypothetical protein